MAKFPKRKELRQLAESFGATPTDARDKNSNVVMQMTLAELEKFARHFATGENPSKALLAAIDRKAASGLEDDNNFASRGLYLKDIRKLIEEAKNG